MLRRRQLSTTEKMVAIFGPASLLPKCNQFLLPIAIERIAFSARLVLSSSSNVAGFFSGGGSTLQQVNDRERNLEIDEDLLYAHGKQTWKVGAQSLGIFVHDVDPDTFNGAFTFGGGAAPVLDSNGNSTGQTTTISGLEQYRRAIHNLPGGTPTSFQVTAGTALVPFTQWQLALYSEDMLKVNSRLTLSENELPYDRHTGFGVEAQHVLRALFRIGRAVELHGDLVSCEPGAPIDGEFLRGVGVVSHISSVLIDKLHIVDGLFAAIIDVEHDHGIWEFGSNPLHELLRPVAIVDAREWHDARDLRILRVDDEGKNDKRNKRPKTKMLKCHNKSSFQKILAT